MIMILTTKSFDNCSCENIERDIIEMINDTVTFHAKDHIVIMEIVD